MTIYNEAEELFNAVPLLKHIAKKANDNPADDSALFCTPFYTPTNPLFRDVINNNPKLREIAERYELQTGKSFTGWSTKVRYFLFCEYQLDKARQKATEIERNRREAFQQAPPMAKFTFNTDDGRNTEATRQAIQYVENYEIIKSEGFGVLFFGDVGTGKTYLACCIINGLIDKGYKCLVTDFRTLASQLENFQTKGEVMRNLLRYDAVLLDDLGTERNSTYMTERVFSIVDALYNNNIPMIITTNLTLAELIDPQDVSRQRIYDRVRERTQSLQYQFTGDSRRRETAREKLRGL